MQVSQKETADVNEEISPRARMSIYLRLWQVSPRWLLSAAAQFLALAVSFLAKKERRQLQRNIHAVLGLPKHSLFAKQFARQVVYHQAHCQIESIKAVLSPDSIEVDGLEELREVLRQARSAGKGVVVGTAHLGSWELVGHFLAKSTDRQAFVLAKPPKWKWLERTLNEFRQQMGTKVLWTNRAGLLREMLQVVKANEILGFVMDQKPDKRVGPRVPFMGFETEFVSGPARIASRTDCRVVMVYCLRTGPWRYRVVARPLAANAPVDVDALTARMAADIEQMIRLYPEQWAWSYRRWRDEDLLRKGAKVND